MPRRVENIYVWIGIDNFGDEEIISATIEGHKCIPLVADRRHIAESLAAHAKEQIGVGAIQRVVLRTFAGAVVENPIKGLSLASPAQRTERQTNARGPA